VASRSIFRETALEAYRRNTARDVLPRLTSWPVVASCWLLVGGLLAVAALAWSLQIPTYVTASGFVVDDLRAAMIQSSGPTAVLLVPPGQAGRLHPGQLVHAQVGASGATIDGRIARVEPGVIAPYLAMERYGFSSTSDADAAPMAAVVVSLPGSGSVTENAGTHLSARIRVGSHRLLSFVPGLGSVGGGNS
jgi:hypothetical protein